MPILYNPQKATRFITSVGSKTLIVQTKIETAHKNAYESFIQVMLALHVYGFMSSVRNYLFTFQSVAVLRKSLQC
jgi:hypothetical protein